VSSQTTILRAFALACLLACKRSPPPPSHDAATTTSASASASAAIADAGPTDIELIWGVGENIGVSSFVDADRDLIEHIADHDASTAWNGNTGDLIGGWFGARLGFDTYVHYVTFIVGFDKKTPTEDFFTANHRITRVRVDCTTPETQEKKMLREVDVDPEVRTPQRVLVDAFCWDLKIVVTGVKPGTHEGWRELAVSEFAIYGWEKPKDPPRPPSVGPSLFMVGTDYDIPKKASLYRGATYEEACTKLIADEDEDEKPIHCGPVGPPQAGHGAMLETTQVPYSNKEFHGELAAFKTAEGAFIVWARTSGRKIETYNGEEVSKIDYRVKSRTWRGDAFVLEIVQKEHVVSPGEIAQRVVCHPASEPWCTVTEHRIDD
jgi:hypothetical protein